jgi:predicted  nucleic acid-binding Zn-ribbon protein
MLTRREISCVRCGERFFSMRRTARFCGQRCRQAASEDRHRLTSTPAPAVEEATATAVDDPDLDGWRRVPGGYVIPPPDRRFTVTTDHGGL